MIIFIKVGKKKNLAPALLVSLLLTDNMFIIRPDSTGKKGVAVPAASSSAAAAAASSASSVVRLTPPARVQKCRAEGCRVGWRARGRAAG
jgi:hypothetical protein